jgi:hypothetical protein
LQANFKLEKMLEKERIFGKGKLQEHIFLEKLQVDND